MWRGSVVEVFVAAAGDGAPMTTVVVGQAGDDPSAIAPAEPLERGIDDRFAR